MQHGEKQHEVGPGPDGQLPAVVVIDRGEDHDPGGGRPRADERYRFEPAQRRHHEIDQRDVGLEVDGKLNRAPPVEGRSDHLESAIDRKGEAEHLDECRCGRPPAARLSRGLPPRCRAR